MGATTSLHAKAGAASGACGGVGAIEPAGDLVGKALKAVWHLHCELHEGWWLCRMLVQRDDPHLVLEDSGHLCHYVSES